MAMAIWRPCKYEVGAESRALVISISPGAMWASPPEADAEAVQSGVFRVIDGIRVQVSTQSSNPYLL